MALGVNKITSNHYWKAEKYACMYVCI